ncbi:MAG: sigma-70 family RNA polymerase sigma factor [Bacteroidota bacterium]
MLLEQPIIENHLETERIDEKSLIESAKNDPRNFRPLYNRHYREIFCFILNKTNDKELTSDLCSQVFLKAMENIQSFEYRGLPFSAWLYRIAINECNQHFRKYAGQRHVILDGAFIDVLFVELEEDRTVYDDQLTKLKVAIQGLKPNDLTIIELRFFDQRPFKEIGHILEITENNAKVKLYRALDRLRKLMLK